MPKIKLCTLSVKIDSDLKGRLDELSNTKGRSIHWILVQAITNYVSQQEKRETLKQDAIIAWKNYTITGIYLTSEQAVKHIEEVADIKIKNSDKNTKH